MASYLRTPNLLVRSNKLASPSLDLHPRSSTVWATRQRHALLVTDPDASSYLGIPLTDLLRAYSAMKVGVPVVPGTPGAVDKWTDADSFIKEYGFPGNCRYSAHIVGEIKRVLSSYHQGRNGWWRPRHACCTRRVRVQKCFRASCLRGQVCVRRWHRLHRAFPRTSPSHRSSDPGRLGGQRCSPV